MYNLNCILVQKIDEIIVYGIIGHKKDMRRNSFPQMMENYWNSKWRLFFLSKESWGMTLQLCKIMRAIDGRPFPIISKSKAREHSFKVRGERFKGNLRRVFFAERVKDIWIELPNFPLTYITCSPPKLQCLKDHFQKYMDMTDLEGCGPKAGKWD